MTDTFAACDAYGGRERVAAEILTRLQSGDQGRSLLQLLGQGASSVETVSRLPWGQVVEAFFCDNVVFGKDLFAESPRWSEATRQEAERRFRQGRAIQMGTDQNLPPSDAAFILFLQSEALREVCGPDPAPTEDERRGLETARRTFRERVGG